MQLANEHLTVHSDAPADVGQRLALLGSTSETVELNGDTPVVTLGTFEEFTSGALSAVCAGTVTVKAADGTAVLVFRPGETARPVDIVAPGLTTVRSPVKALHGEPGFDFPAANLENFTLTERHTVENHDQPLAYGTAHPGNSRLLLVGQKLTDGENGKRIHVRVYSARLEAGEQKDYGYTVLYPYVAKEFPRVQWNLRIAVADYEGMEFSQECLVAGYDGLELVEEVFAVDALGVFGTLTLTYESLPGPEIRSEGYDERGDLELTITQTARNDDDPPAEVMGYLYNEATKTGVDAKRATLVKKTVARRSPLWTEDAFTVNRTLMRHITGVKRTTRKDIVAVGTPADTGFFVVESSVRDLTKWKAEKTTMRVDAFKTLTSTDRDRTANGALVITTESIVPSLQSATGSITVTSGVGPATLTIGGAGGFLYTVATGVSANANTIAEAINAGNYTFTAVASGSTLTISARTPGDAGNAITLSETGSVFGLTSSTLLGGWATTPPAMDVSTLESKVEDLDGTHALKTVKKLAEGESWPTLTSTRIDHEMNVAITTARTKVAAGSVTVGSAIVDGSLVVTEEEPVPDNPTLVYEVVTTIPQPAAVDEASAVIGSASMAYSFPARVVYFNVYGGYSFERYAPRAEIVNGTSKKWWVISHSKPTVTALTIVPGWAFIVASPPPDNLPVLRTFFGVLHDQGTVLHQSAASVPTLSAYMEMVNTEQMIRAKVDDTLYQKLWKVETFHAVMR